MKILWFTVLFAAVAAVTAENCEWGESYWCSDLRIAKACGAFKHCMSTVWKNTKPLTQLCSGTSSKKDSTEVCDFCKSIVDDAKEFIASKKAEKEIKQFLDSACAVLPDKTLAADCKDVVDNYLEEILTLITSEMDPQVVCAAMGLCQGFEDHLHKAVVKQKPIVETSKPTPPICADCTKFMQDIKDIVTDKTTEDEIKKLLDENLCSKLGAVEDYCKQVVDTYLPEIFKMLSDQFVPKDICSAMGFCNGAKAKAMLSKLRFQKSAFYKAAKEKSSTESCLICKTILGELQTLDRDPKVQGAIEDFLKNNLCERLGSLKDACNQAVEEYATDLFEILAAELDPDLRCRALGFCASSDIAGVIRQAQLSKPVQKKRPSGNLRTSSQCILCEFLMDKLEDLLKENATTQEIIAALDKVCSLFPDTIKDECTAFVNEYGPAVLMLLEQELDPATICKTLGLCNGKRISMPKAKDSELCGVCETVIQYVDSLLEQNATVQEIEKILEKVCNFLPDTYKNQCDDLVEQYGPLIVQLLSQYADPKEICTLIGLCDNTTHHVTENNIQPIKHTLLGKNECTWGPSYWCDKRENAVKCKAVEHCEKHVWKK